MVKFYLVYKVNKKKIKLLNDKFINKNRYKGEIIINNKKYPIMSEYKVKETDIETFKMKLIIFDVSHLKLEYMFAESDLLRYYSKNKSNNDPKKEINNTSNKNNDNRPLEENNNKTSTNLYEYTTFEPKTTDSNKIYNFKKIWNHYFFPYVPLKEKEKKEENNKEKNEENNKEKNEENNKEKNEENNKEKNEENNKDKPSSKQNEIQYDINDIIINSYSFKSIKILNEFNNNNIKDEQSKKENSNKSKSTEIQNKSIIRNFEENFNFNKNQVFYIINMSYMFCNCKYLIDVSGITELKTDQCIGIDYLFYGCSLLESLPDISKLVNKNTKNISGMF